MTDEEIGRFESQLRWDTDHMQEQPYHEHIIELIADWKVMREALEKYSKMSVQEMGMIRREAAIEALKKIGVLK